MPTQLQTAIVLAALAGLLAGCAGVGSGELTLGDYVWLDANENGLQDDEEIGAAAVRVSLLVYNPNTDTTEFLANTITDNEGFFEFTGLEAGTYQLEFDLPDDAEFTEQDEGDDDAIDSDADPGTGLTELIELGESEARWDAGIIPQGAVTPVPPPTPTATPAGESTASPTPSATPTTVPTPDNTTPFEDDMDDATVCDSEEPAQDAEVDMTTFNVGWNGNVLWVQVMMKAPLVNDYSFAVLLFAISGEDQRLFLWEVHEGVHRIGQLNPQTGELLPEQPQGLAIQHDRTTGKITFNLPAGALAARVEQIGARSFHTPAQGQTKNCDVAGLFNLPAEFQQP